MCVASSWPPVLERHSRSQREMRMKPIVQRRRLTAILLNSSMLVSLGLFTGSATHHVQAAASSGTLIIAEAETPDTLNPLLTQTLSGVDIFGGVFDNLVHYNDKGTLVGDLATSWSHDASGLHW